MYKMTKQWIIGNLFIYLFCKQNTYLKLLNQGEFKLIIFFFIQCQGSEANEKECRRVREGRAEKKLRQETAVSESRLPRRYTSDQ
jgi:hypothetical protein